MDRIALISTYVHPSRDSIERMLAAAFPEFEIENFWINDVLKLRRRWVLPNLCHVARDYGADLLARRVSLREAYFRTPYAFRKIHGAMRHFIDPQRHVFSFQMQSLYDTSVAGVPHFVYTDHTHLSNLAYPDFDRRSLRSPEWVALERRLYERAATVFTRSTNVARDLTTRYGIPADRVACVYAGSNVDVAWSGPSDDSGYASRRILFVGFDWMRKGGPDLLRAFRSVLQVHPDAELVIAGAAPPVDVPRCTVLGPLPPEELSRHYARASVFCLPTRREPFGIAFIEAMAHRLPIVATRVGAVPDMVEEGLNGHLVEPGDVPGLAQALIGLMGDPARCALYGRRGYERAMDRFTWPRTGERIRARVMSVLAGAGRLARDRARPPGTARGAVTGGAVTGGAVTGGSLGARAGAEEP